MRKSVKALLLSIFALPGAGHYILKQRKLAFVLMAVSFGILLSIFFKCVNIINDLVVDISTGKLAFDITAISEAVHQQLGQSMGNMINLFILLWVLSAVDAYRLGIKADKEEVL